MFQRKKKTLCFGEKVKKLQSVNLRLQSKMETNKRKVEKCPQVCPGFNMEVSVSEALFPPLHSSVSFMNISLH